MKTFKDVWKFPLTLDSYSDYVFDSEMNMCLQFNDDNYEVPTSVKRWIVLAINTNREKETPTLWVVGKGSYSDGDIYFSNVKHPLLTIRGWGLMTGPMKLPDSEAIRIQDEFGEYIINCLNHLNHEQRSE